MKWTLDNKHITKVCLEIYNIVLIQNGMSCALSPCDCNDKHGNQNNNDYTLYIPHDNDQ